MKQTKIIFSPAAVGKRIFNAVSTEQTNRLIDYAKERIVQIGNDISVAPTRNNLDRTGNLLDSLCWAVYFNGVKKGFGYYRKEEAVENSHLHEYSRPMGKSVNGRAMANDFIGTYSPTREKGWELFFAVLAPYWGYWEKGFEHKMSNNFFQWSVMTMNYDDVKRDLSPSKVTFHNYIPS
jgi:hypothetical protein